MSLASLKGIDLFSVYISQDGSHPGVAALVERLGRTLFPLPKARGFVHWQHSRTPLLGPTQVHTALHPLGRDRQVCVP